MDVDAHKLARRDDPATSKAAAERVREFASTHHTAILAALSHAPDGLTIYEIAAATGLEIHAVGRRMSELQDAGLAWVIENQYGAITRPTPSGRQARVWFSVILGEVHAV